MLQLHDIDVIEKKIGLQYISPRLSLVAEVRKNLPYASVTSHFIRRIESF